MTNPDAAVAHAYSRFGFGGRPSDGAPTDIRAWLLAQLVGADPLAVGGQMTVAEGLGLCADASKARAANDTATASALHTTITTQWNNEAYNLYAGAVATTAPFRERLVWFWMNHFGIIRTTNESWLLAGAFVRDAIRPFVTGDFASMLQAAIHHPAMLYSLDNVGSRGPQSPIGVRAARLGRAVPGTNQNLGRETLELYTVGVGSGYTQADVVALSSLLTGLQVSEANAPRGYFYDVQSAQPGPQLLLGQTFAGTEAGSTAALRMLATHPATYNHLATKLVTHFVSDTPAAADVAAIAAVLARTGGNLGAAAEAIVGLASAWVPLEKVRTPSEHAIAMFRAMDAGPAETLSLLGSIPWLLNLPWATKFANGWSDMAVDWIGPTQMARRVYMAWFLAARMSASRTAQSGLLATTAAASVAPFLSSAVATAVLSVSGARNQLTVLFTLPEFMRR